MVRNIGMFTLYQIYQIQEYEIGLLKIQAHSYFTSVHI